MDKKIYFKLEERDGKYIIIPVFENLPLEYTEGSFNLLPARLMQLNYADYLRMCRDMCGATIMGKGQKYPIAYFGGSPQAMIVTRQLVRLLNARANLALWDRKYPDKVPPKKSTEEDEDAREDMKNGSKK